MSLREVTATRYVVALREGGSLPGVIEGDDGKLWVAKFRAAGQGPGALIAEVIAGELGRVAGLPIPELVVLVLPGGFGTTEGDPEIHDLVMASVGENLGVAFLTGALGFDPAAHVHVSPALASKIVAFDVLVSNVDRTVRNPNILCVGHELWLIDHGAALYWHHAWDGGLAGAAGLLPRLAEHVLLPVATELPAAATALIATLDDAALTAAVAAVPESWLLAMAADPDARRAAYVARLRARRDVLGELVAHA